MEKCPIVKTEKEALEVFQTGSGVGIEYTKVEEKDEIPEAIKKATFAIRPPAS